MSSSGMRVGVDAEDEGKRDRDDDGAVLEDGDGGVVEPPCSSGSEVGEAVMDDGREGRGKPSPSTDLEVNAAAKDYRDVTKREASPGTQGDDWVNQPSNFRKETVFVGCGEGKSLDGSKDSTRADVMEADTSGLAAASTVSSQIEEDELDGKEGSEVYDKAYNELDDISPNSTPPPRGDEIDRSQCHIDLEEWGQSLHDAAQAVFPNTPSSRYRNVYVLMLKWEDEDPQLPVSYDIPQLRSVFEQTYGFETELWDIKDHDCHMEVNQKIINFSRKGGNSKEDLKILFYAGHGKITGTRLLSWTSWRNNEKMKCPTVKWSGIQNVLEEAQSDVLLLLDCCNAGIANTDEGEGVTELISACSYNSNANGVGYYSFTHALVLELKKLALRSSFSVGELYHKVYTRTQVRIPDDESETERHPAPVHLVLTCDRKYMRSIQLSPRVRLEQGNEGAGEIQGRAGSSLPWMPPNLSSLMVEKAPRLALSIRFHPNLRFKEMPPDLFTEWLRSMPMIAEQVKVEAAFDCFSSLLIVSIPMALSAYLPWNPAVTYLGPITSTNKITTLPYTKAESCVVDCGQETQKQHLGVTPDEQSTDEKVYVSKASDPKYIVESRAKRFSRSPPISSLGSGKTEQTFQRPGSVSSKDKNYLSYYGPPSPLPATQAELDPLKFKKGIMEFSRKLQKAAINIFPSGGSGRYIRVSCLLFSWEDEDPQLRLSVDIKSLMEVLRETYNYDVEEYRIPSRNSNRLVRQKMLQFLDDEGPTHLKIVYYFGHGKTTANGSLEWRCLHLNSYYWSSPRVKWSAIQGLLEDSTSDVLILIDSDAVGLCITNEGIGATELVAAYGFGSQANGVGFYSFTNTLIIELLELQHLSSFTVRFLYDRIITRIQNQQVGNSRHHPVPVHLFLTRDNNQPRNIRLPLLPNAIEAPATKSKLRPLLMPPSPPDTGPPSQPFDGDPGPGKRTLLLPSPSDEPRFPETEMNELGDRKVKSKELESEAPRLLFAFRLQETVKVQDLSPDVFADWLRQLPIATESVKVEAVFSSD